MIINRTIGETLVFTPARGEERSYSKIGICKNRGGGLEDGEFIGFYPLKYYTVLCTLYNTILENEAYQNISHRTLS